MSELWSMPIMVMVMVMTVIMKVKTFCLSESWSMNVSITAKAEGENLFRSSILMMMTIFLTRMTIMIIDHHAK